MCADVGTSSAALTSIDTFQPDVVMLEWSLRDGTGIGLASLLRRRSLHHQRKLFVVAVSTQAETAGFLEAEELDGYFTKPLLLDAFVELLPPIS